MSCQAREAELLQALAAGTLSEAERRAVLAHAAACQECRAELPLLNEMVDGLRSLHLTGEELVEAAWSGRRPEHLRDCGACSAEVETLRRVNRELVGPRGSFGIPHALAASLLVATLGLGFWNEELRQSGASTASDLAAARERLARTEAQLKQRPRETPAPSLNVPIVDLEPAIPTRSGAAPRPVLLEYPAGVDQATLIIVTRPMRPDTGYVLEVRDAGSRVLWRSEGLTRSPYDTLTLSVPRALLPPGSYRFILYGGRDGALHHLEEYTLVVKHR